VEADGFRIRLERAATPPTGSPLANGGFESGALSPSSTSYTKLSVQFTTGAGTTSVTIFVHGWYA
jgi:hypothetical protein